VPGAPTTRRSARRLGVEQRRTEILEAARRVLLGRGLTGTRVGDVADALGVSTGLIHYHFASKDDLLVETLRFAADADIRRLEKSMASGADAVERLDRVLREYLPARRDDPSWLLWIDVWGSALREPGMREISEELDAAWVAVLERTIADGVQERRFRCDDAAGAAWRLACLMDGLGLQVVLHRSTLSRARMLDHARTAAARELGLRRDALPAGRSA